MIVLLQEDGWDVHVITTPAAAEWINTDRLAKLTEHPIRMDLRRPDQPKSLPRADAVAVVPATFNTINKWASGINDTLALGILNEAMGGNLPIVVAPYAKPALVSHPVFDLHLEFHRRTGLIFTSQKRFGPPNDDQPFLWSIILAELHAATSMDR